MGLGHRLSGFDQRRLQRWLLLFFLALLIPSGVLVWYAYSQLKWEAFHQYRLQAEALIQGIGRDLDERVEREQQRPFSDYAFLAATEDSASTVVQRSPLSAYPVTAALPGVLGYFQVDDRGRLSTPLLPRVDDQARRFGIDAGELAAREALQARLQQILSDNRLVASADGVRGERPDARVEREADSGLQEQEVMPVMAPSLSGLVSPKTRMAEQKSAREGGVPAQSAFDQLTAPPKRKAERRKESVSALGRVEDLKLDPRFEARVSESESTAAQLNDTPPARDRQAVRIHTFENELDPFEFSLLDSGHFVLFRKVWRDGRRFIQGMLIERQPLLRSLIGERFRESPLAAMSDLRLAYRGDLFSIFDGDLASYRHPRELSGALLYRSALPPPLADLELIFSINHLPAGAGGRLITWMGASLLLVLCGGFYLMYRLALRQLELTRQQQDFVSAVSHELKTPLTSIRMYGEMLREGWTSEENRLRYYDYIQQESERLSRLINNVLQLARMTRNELRPECRSLQVSELMEETRGKVATQVEQAGFELEWQVAAEAAGRQVRLDPDSFSQIMINLVDNAVKFSADAVCRRIEVGAILERGDQLVFSVRDYGPGIPRDQMKKIFSLFYRPQSELTRETVGTGIGLALVAELTSAMHGQVDLINRQPGALFRVIFPSQSAGV